MDKRFIAMNSYILNFHGIGSPHAHVPGSELNYWLDIEPFEAILDDVVEMRRSRNINVILSFDDGNRSDLEIAVPALQRRGLCAMFFVCAGRLTQENYLNAGALRDMLVAGMSIGSHGMNHVDWRSSDLIQTEIFDARRQLQDATGDPILEAGIPFGLYSRHVIKSLHGAGFIKAYTSDGGMANMDKFLVARQTVTKSMAVPNMLQKLIGDETVRKSLIRKLKTIAKSIR